ncbi:hypothetical protein QTO34_007974 [Cnephaeus nilssonii]|uniref:ATP-dependent DNA helicase n=1 Tax=Cnephaeus nilssonii TaxID=3371016 RepID=A0AA40IAB8_CNENI|nr:hypothetical protein QTO34_007974 [Eptesicus nilssonii]
MDWYLASGVWCCPSGLPRPLMDPDPQERAMALPSPPALGPKAPVGLKEEAAVVSRTRKEWMPTSLSAPYHRELGDEDSRVPDSHSYRWLKRPALLRPALRKTLVAELGVAECVAAGTSFPPAAVFLWPPARSERLSIGVPLGVADRAGGRCSDRRVARGKLLLADNWCRQPDNIKNISKCAILCPKNENVHELNEGTLDIFDGDFHTYLSDDSINSTDDAEKENFPIEFLNSIIPLGMPCHKLKLKFPVMPAFGMTINKSQGQTVDRVGIFLPEPVFRHGQLYVAFSRVQRLALAFAQGGAEKEKKKKRRGWEPRSPGGVASLQTAISPSPRLAKHPSGDLHPEGGVTSLKTALNPSLRLANPHGVRVPAGGMASLQTAISLSPRLARHPSGIPQTEGAVASLKTALSPSPRLATPPPEQQPCAQPAPSEEQQLHEQPTPTSQRSHHCCEQCSPEEPLPTEEQLLHDLTPRSFSESKNGETKKLPEERKGGIARKAAKCLNLKPGMEPATQSSSVQHWHFRGGAEGKRWPLSSIQNKAEPPATAATASTIAPWLARGSRGALTVHRAAMDRQAWWAAPDVTHKVQAMIVTGQTRQAAPDAVRGVQAVIGTGQAQRTAPDITRGTWKPLGLNMAAVRGSRGRSGRAGGMDSA